MTQNVADPRYLTELHPARRNRYYYGKLLDVRQLGMEQSYGLAKRELANRLELGAGVVCGLDVVAVTTAAGSGVRISAGVALDAWGREIVVPDDVTLVPLLLTDDCANPAPATQPLPARVNIGVCYRECLADYTPALVSDPLCGGGDRCEAGTVVESYCLRVRGGAAPAVTAPCPDGLLKLLQAGDVHGALCSLTAGACQVGPDDPCVVLANVGVASDGTLTVDACGPRAIVPTNLVLLQLISCLAACCSGGTVSPSIPPKPSPTPPTPSLPPPATVTLPPAPQKPLEVSGLQLARVRSATGSYAQPPVVMQAPVDPWQVKMPEQPYNAIEVTFVNKPLDPATVTWGNPSDQVFGSFWFQPGSGQKLAPPQVVPLAGNTIRLFFSSGIPPGPYRIVLFGDASEESGGLAVSATDGTRLDGRRKATWPSGSGTQGGEFVTVLELA